MDQLNSKGVDISKYKEPTIVVSLVTVFSYFCLLGYQYSFLRYFGIPSYFLEFNLMNMLFVVIVLVLTVSIIFLCVAPLRSVLKNERFYFKKHWINLILYYAPLIFIFIVFYDLEKSKFFNLLNSLFFALFWTLQILLWNKKKASIETNNKIFFLTKTLDIWVNNLGKNLFLLIMILLFLLDCSFIAGKSMAQWQEEYLVINLEPKVAIIKTYQNSLLAISFNEEAKTFGRNFYLISNDRISSENIKITREHIGPLTNGSFYIESDIFTSFYRHAKDSIFLKSRIHNLKSNIYKNPEKTETYINGIKD